MVCLFGIFYIYFMRSRSREAEKKPEEKEKEDISHIHKYVHDASTRNLLQNNGIQSFFPIQYATYDHIHKGNTHLIRL